MTIRRGILETLAAYDKLGGANLSLAAWDLCSEPEDIADSWRAIHDAGWLEPAGIDPVSRERMFRLSALGWAAFSEMPPAAESS